MVDKNQRYLGSFHQRLKRAPIIKTTKSPSIEAAMRRLIVAIGEIVPQGSTPAWSPRADVLRPPLALSSRGVRLDSETIVDGAS